MKFFYLPLLVLTINTTAAHSLKFGGNLGFSRTSEDGVTSSATPIELRAQYQWRQMYMRLDYGLAVSSVSTYYRDTRTALRSGSAVATLQLGKVAGPFEILYGIKIGLAPLTLQSGSLEDKVMTVHTYRSAGSAMGWQQPFLWLMNNYPALAAASLRTRNLPVTFSVEMATGYLFSLNQQPGRFALHGRAQVSYERFEVQPFVGMNYLQISQSLENNDTNQTTAFAGVSYSVGQVLLSTAANVNIDQPYGIMADGTPHFWGVYCGAVYQTGIADK